jgi:hypothetical protein
MSENKKLRIGSSCTIEVKMNFFVLGFILFVAAIGWVADFIERRSADADYKRSKEKIEREWNKPYE